MSGTLRLEIGDITRFKTDAIVNAANSGLRGGGGVDGAIHRAGGPAIMRELDAIRRHMGHCPTGSAVVTGAGRLRARWVIHAVGPVWSGGGRGEPERLAACYRTSLALAEERGARRIAFPSISTGAYGYPVEEAARVAIATVAAHLRRPENAITEATFVLFDPATHEAYRRALDENPLE
jgi:O-acetyl-ADP-ribose deacetylase (regulator of RNase III)